MNNNEDSLGKRNAETAMSKLREMDNMIREQRIMLDNFANTLTMFEKRLREIEEINIQQRIARMGNGATVKDNGKI